MISSKGQMIMKIFRNMSLLVMRRVYSYDIETKQQSSHWQSFFTFLQESTTGVLSSGSNAVWFFQSSRHVHYEFAPEGQTIKIFI
jgi:hypothetical protein